MVWHWSRSKETGSLSFISLVSSLPLSNVLLHSLWAISGPAVKTVLVLESISLGTDSKGEEHVLVGGQIEHTNKVDQFGPVGTPLNWAQWPHASLDRVAIYWLSFADVLIYTFPVHCIFFILFWVQDVTSWVGSSIYFPTPVSTTTQSFPCTFEIYL